VSKLAFTGESARRVRFPRFAGKTATPRVTPTVLPRPTTSPRSTSTTARALAASSST